MGPNYTGLDKGFYADSAVPQFNAVRLTDVENVTLNDGTGLLVGICQEEVEARDAGRRVVNVRLEGITRAVADGAIGLGVVVYVATGGRVTAAATRAEGTATVNNTRIGRCLTPATAAGYHIDLWLTQR